MADSGELTRRRKAWRRGHLSEYLAALFLVAKGYRILAIRHRTHLGEIDIIARKGDLAIFVEVKARRDERQAIDAVSYAAQRRIRAASDLWLARRPDHAALSQRYDIVAILPGRWPRHFPDAF
jgi:putative endonuclease